MINRSGDEKRIRIQGWCGALRRAGYRLTPARRTVVTTIADFGGPFNAAQLLACAQAKQPQLGLATVYRTLDTLEALGLIQRVGGTPNAEQIAWVRAEYGLDRPLWVQYGQWLGQIIQGDLGYSIRTDKPIRQELGKHLRLSVGLGGVTMLFVLLLAIPTGVLAARHNQRLGDQFVRFNALLFAVYLGWLPAFGAKSWQHFLLPIVTLGVGHAARLSRLLRSLVLDQLLSDYLRTARAKGLPARSLLWHHLLPNIAVSFITVSFITVAVQQFGMLISGTIIIETLFSLPGLGNYYAQAVSYRDIPVIQATVLLFAGLILLLNLLVDLSYPFFDPRIRYRVTAKR